MERGKGKTNESTSVFDWKVTMRRFAVFTFTSLIGLALLLAGCGTSEDAYVTPTPQNNSPVDVIGTMAMADLNAKVTQQAVGIIYTGTAQVMQVTLNAQSTQAAMAVTEQYRNDAVATDAQARQDAAATQSRMDADAAALQAKLDAQATESQMRIDAQAKQSADATATWDALTMTALPTHAVLTQQAAMVEQTKSASDAQLAVLNVEQQTEKNTPEWIIPYLGLLVAVIVGAVYIIRQSRSKTIMNPETGVIEAVIIDNVQSFKPQLMTKPMMLLKPGAEHVDPKEQSDVTRRAQIAEALRAMPTQQPTPNAVGMMNGLLGDPAPRFQVLDERDAPPAQLLDAEAKKSLEQDWKESDE